jgi:uncharacterized protein YraI
MRRVLFLALVTGLLLAAAGCGGTTSTTSTTPGSSSTGASTSEATTSSSEVTTITEPTTTQATTTTTEPPPGSYAVDAVDACVIGSAPGATVNVRSGPGSANDIVGTLAEDATGVHATGWAARDAHNDEWRQIEFGDGTGWVFSTFLTPGLCLLGSATTYCTNDAACTDVPNVRTGLGIGYDAVTTLPRNATGVAGTGATAQDLQDRTWVQVHHDGHLGWVAGWLLDASPCNATTCSPPSLPWTITAAGVGPILLGMAPGDVEYLTGFDWTWESPGAAGCLWGSTAAVDVNLQSHDGTAVNDILVYQAGAAQTAAGIHVGSTRGALNAAYAGHITQTGPTGYGEYGVWVDLNNDGAADMLAVFASNGIAAPITDIRLPAHYIEGGCL